MRVGGESLRGAGGKRSGRLGLVLPAPATSYLSTPTRSCTPTSATPQLALGCLVSLFLSLINVVTPLRKSSYLDDVNLILEPMNPHPGTPRLNAVLMAGRPACN